MINILVHSLSGGGTERQISLLSNLIKLDRIFMFENSIEYEVECDKIIQLTNNSKNSQNFIKYITIPYFIYKLKKIVNKSETIVSFLERANYVNIIAKPFIKHRTIIAVRTHISKSYNRGIKRIHIFLIRLLYPFADLIIVNSFESRQDLIDIFKINPKKITVIPNIVNSEFILKQREKPICEQHKDIFKNPVVITVGRLTKQKGHWHLIRAFKDLKKKFQNLKLVIVGKGPLEEYLKNLSKELKLNDDIFFIGHVTNPFSYLAKSSIFILPSLWEGFPNVLLEAMACGLPVIAADCFSGPRELLEPKSILSKKTNVIEKAKYGILIPVCDGIIKSTSDKLTIEELNIVESMSCLLEDKILYRNYKNLCQERISSYSTTNVAPMWSSILNPNT